MNLEKQKEIVDKSILVSIHRLSHLIYLKHNEVLASTDITSQQSRLLRFILHNRDKGVVNQRDIEKHFEIKGSSVSSLIKNLIEKELVIKTQNQDDGRYYNLDITKKGIETEKISFEIFNDYNEKLVKDIPKENIENFKMVLDLIKKNIGSQWVYIFLNKYLEF